MFADIRNMANEDLAVRPSSVPEYWETSASSPNLSAMSSASPTDQYANKLAGSGYGSGQSDSGKSPLSMSLGFLKTLTEKKNTRGMLMDLALGCTDANVRTVDGQAPKRRGPKPDSKPALTRRQELNRQAQRYVDAGYMEAIILTLDRTHRERKELYIKALEQEVLRLKENYSLVSRDKETLAEENRQLKQLLAQHGIPWNGSGGVDELTRNASVGYTSSGSVSGSYAPGSQSASPTPQNYSSNNANPNYSSASPPNGANGRSIAGQQVQRGVDYDQAGIDFVLTYADPSKSYMSPPPQ